MLTKVDVKEVARQKLDSDMDSYWKQKKEDAKESEWSPP